MEWSGGREDADTSHTGEEEEGGRGEEKMMSSSDIPKTRLPDNRGADASLT